MRLTITRNKKQANSIILRQYESFQLKLGKTGGEILIRNNASRNLYIGVE